MNKIGGMSMDLILYHVTTFLEIFFASEFFVFFDVKWHKANVLDDEQVPISERLVSFPLTFKINEAYFWFGTVDFDTEYCR